MKQNDRGDPVDEWCGPDVAAPPPPPPPDNLWAIMIGLALSGLTAWFLFSG